MSLSTPLYAQVKEHLITLIQNMSPNEKLPSRKVLCQELQVGKITIDRAISELIGEGLLYAQNGSGTYVAERKENCNLESANVTWGVIVPHTETFLFPQLINGLSDVAIQHNINLILCNTDDNYRKEETYIASLIRTKVNGIIIVPSLNERATYLSAYHSLAAVGIPFILCNRDIRGVNAPIVKSNHYYGGYIATKHLLEHGFQKIAFAGQKRYSIVDERYSGYVAALEEFSLPIDPEYVFMHDSFDEKTAAASAAQKFLTLEHRPDAIFCFNDYIAFLLYDKLTHAGIRIPDDISLVSCDNSILCDLLPCKLTSIDCSSYQVGQEAALQLLRLTGLIPNLPPSPYMVGNLTLLPQKLVIRKSCGCHPIEKG